MAISSKTAEFLTSLPCLLLILCSLKCLTLLNFVLYYKIMSLWYLPYLVPFSGSCLFLDHSFLPQSQASVTQIIQKYFTFGFGMDY